jgi:hypothetical protein
MNMPKPLYLFTPEFESQEINKATNTFNKKWLEKHIPVKKELYHYTTLNGLQGIIKERALWFSHVSSLNDRLEIQYGRELIVNIIRDFVVREEREDIRLFLQNLLTTVQFFSKAWFETFVACFCESSNLLSQWRGYANKDGGYCLGFEFSSSTRTASDVHDLNIGKDIILRKIIYTGENQSNLVKEYIENICQAAKKALDDELAGRYPDSKTYVPGVIAFQASNILFDLLICFKHSAFFSEEEWRMVLLIAEHHQPEYLRFRESLSGLIPYRSTHIYNVEEDKMLMFPLRMIGIGPMLEPVRTCSAIKLLIRNIASDQHPIKLIPHHIEITEAGYSLNMQ